VNIKYALSDPLAGPARISVVAEVTWGMMLTARTGPRVSLILMVQLFAVWF
jgi:hypothetical protein